MVELSNRRMVEWGSCRIVEVWNSGVVGDHSLPYRRMVELSNRLIMELVELSNRRMNGGMVE